MRKHFSMKRILTGILIGLLSRMIYQQIDNHLSSLQLKQYCLCHIDKLCPMCEPTKLVAAPSSQSRYYEPKGMYEITRWSLLDKNIIYDIINEEPKLNAIGIYREELQEAMSIGMDYLNANQLMGQKWSFVSLYNSYYRIDSLYGTNIILDMVVKSVTTTYDEIENERVFRIELIHPLLQIENSKIINNKKRIQQKIKAVVPVLLDSPHINAIIENFANMDDDSAELVLVLFYDEKDESAQAKLNAISKKISQSSSNHITLLQEKGSFSHVAGLRKIVSETDSNDIILIVEENMVFKKGLLEHCRSLCDEKKRAYFPVPYAQFDGHVIENGMPPGKSQQISKQDHNKFTGHWAHQVHSAFCAYNNDVSQILSSDAGTDDNWVYQQFLKEDYQVLMAVDPYLYKPNQSNRCLSKKTNGKQCLKTEALHLGSKPSLGVLYIKETSLTS